MFIFILLQGTAQNFLLWISSIDRLESIIILLCAQFSIFEADSAQKNSHTQRCQISINEKYILFGLQIINHLTLVRMEKLRYQETFFWVSFLRSFERRRRRSQHESYKSIPSHSISNRRLSSRHTNHTILIHKIILLSFHFHLLQSLSSVSLNLNLPSLSASARVSFIFHILKIHNIKNKYVISLRFTVSLTRT